MANRNSVKIVAIKQNNARSVSLNLQLGSERGTYDVSIIDRNGVFGLELPDALGLKLRSFPPAESRNLVASVKREIVKNLISA
jgi:hypothetical protein